MIPMPLGREWPNTGLVILALSLFATYVAARIEHDRFYAPLDSAQVVVASVLQ